MNDNELKTNADFLSIAIEEMNAGNTETAKEFVEDVQQNLLDEVDDL